MKCLYKLSLTPLALALSFPVAADQSWSGLYFGAMINQGSSSIKSDTTYSNDAASPPVGWSQNQFKGDLLNSIDSMHITHPFDLQASNTISLPLWGGGSNQNQSITSGTFLAGKNIQSGNIVLGGEIRVSFGNFNSSSKLTNAGSGSNSMSDFEGPTVVFTNYNSSLSGITSPITSPSTGARFDNSVNYSQTGTQSSDAKYNNFDQLIGRVGYSFGDVMAYLIGGVAYANVSATTTTLINESASGVLTYPDSSKVNYTGSASYSFSGQTTKSMFGPSIGAGMEWAIKDNTSLRLEGQYYNLGKVSVKGISAQTSASYSVNQEISAYNISIGLIRKF